MRYFLGDSFITNNVFVVGWSPLKNRAPRIQQNAWMPSCWVSNSCTLPWLPLWGLIEINSNKTFIYMIIEIVLHNMHNNWLNIWIEEQRSKLDYLNLKSPKTRTFDAIRVKCKYNDFYILNIFFVFSYEWQRCCSIYDLVNGNILRFYSVHKTIN